MINIGKTTSLLNYYDRKDYCTEANVKNIFTVLSYKWASYSRVFAPGKHFQPSLMFASKGGAYPSRACFRLGKVLNLPPKVFQGQTV